MVEDGCYEVTGEVRCLRCYNPSCLVDTRWEPRIGFDRRMKKIICSFCYLEFYCIMKEDKCWGITR